MVFFLIPSGFMSHRLRMARFFEVSKWPFFISERPADGSYFYIFYFFIRSFFGPDAADASLPPIIERSAPHFANATLNVAW